MKARELAFDLSRLDRRQRAVLLAELPDQRRVELERMIDEVERLSASTRSFESELLAAEANPDQELSRLNAGQLRLLLAAECHAVQRRIIEAIAHDQWGSFPVAARSVLAEFLRHRSQTNRVETASSRRHSTWWRPWRR